MFYYKLKLSYKGTEYFGWQSQPKEGRDTVQDTIFGVLRRISKYEDCSIVGASRTDAGVHAQGQVAKVTIPRNIGPDKLLMGMNSALPRDIRILECSRSPREFNPIKDAKTKEYHYYFSNKLVESPLLSEIVDHISEPLDLELMNQGAAQFIGEHDFYNFSRRDSNALTTIRRITACQVLSAAFGHLDTSVYYVRVEGTGFLKQMVRYMVASLFEVGHGNISINDIAHYLNNHKEDKLCPRSRARGLHLVKINYYPCSTGQ